MSYTGGLGQVASNVSLAATQYRIDLGNLQSQITGMIARQSTLVGSWVQAAQAAGISTATINIQVYGPQGAWSQAMSDLRDIIIAREIIRLQQGGTPGDINQFRPTAAPALPPIPSLPVNQPIAGPPPPTVSLPPVVLQSPTAATTSLLNQLPPASVVAVGPTPSTPAPTPSGPIAPNVSLPGSGGVLAVGPDGSTPVIATEGAGLVEGETGGSSKLWLYALLAGGFYLMTRTRGRRVR